MTFQILIASVYARTDQLARLLGWLSGQAAPYNGEVGVLVDRDDCAEPVGVKRTRLLMAATGDYVCFIDDDDQVREDYVAQIMYALTSRPDYVGFRVAYTLDGVRQKDAIHKLGQAWETTGGAYLRGVSHLNPIRHEIALTGLPFLDGFGEDHDWAHKIEASGLVKASVYIDECLYHYKSSARGSLFTGGPQRVGDDPGLPSYPFVEVIA